MSERIRGEIERLRNQLAYEEFILGDRYYKLWALESGIIELRNKANMYASQGNYGAARAVMEDVKRYEVVADKLRYEISARYAKVNQIKRRISELESMLYR